MTAKTTKRTKPHFEIFRNCKQEDGNIIRLMIDGVIYSKTDDLAGITSGTLIDKLLQWLINVVNQRMSIFFSQIWSLHHKTQNFHSCLWTTMWCHINSAHSDYCHKMRLLIMVSLTEFYVSLKDTVLFFVFLSLFLFFFLSCSNLSDKPSPSNKEQGTWGIQQWQQQWQQAGAMSPNWINIENTAAEVDLIRLDYTQLVHAVTQTLAPDVSVWVLFVFFYVSDAPALGGQGLASQLFCLCPDITEQPQTSYLFGFLADSITTKYFTSIFRLFWVLLLLISLQGVSYYCTQLKITLN